MDRILVASSNDKATAMLVSLLKETFPTCKTSIAATGLETRRAVGSGSYDCVVINCPLSDEYGNELAEIVCTSTDASCVAIAKSENADILADKLEDFGVMVIPKPLGRQYFSENLKLHKKLEEIRTINRAKCSLMQYLGFTEQQAHKYLEKQAMDKRCTKIEVAQKVIEMYEV
ncbi:MAG TPA: ANTAR domain-containing protein [Ruminococcus bicirculans (ex Wegman et al. 2014)]|nr:ANTAR domain-containing protein [Ruminococcus bicirculans (ex Wegman et al. 2014)]